MNNFLVSPALSHVCSKVDITGNGFEPNTPLTIQGKLVCLEEGFDFKSYAHIYTNDEGYFDLKTTESIGGTYKGADQMGLFCSMVTQIENYVNRANFKDGLREITYDFNVFQSHVDNFDPAVAILLSSAKCTRYLAENVIKKPVKHRNVRGTLFLPAGKGEIEQRSAVIVLKGGLKKRGYLQEDQAALLSNEGFVVLNLAFFGMEDLPNNYIDAPIRIEYFEEAVEFLHELDEVDSERIYVLGVSKGGDIALAMMSHLPQIKKVCWLNGDIASITTPTTYKGEITNALSGNVDRVKILDSKTLDIRDYFANPLDEPNSIHNFQRSNADLLMVVGVKDGTVNVVERARIAKDRMDFFGKTNYTILEFPDLAHLVDVPYMPVCVHDMYTMIPKGMRIFYGIENIRATSYAQFEAWRSIVRFFKGMKLSKL